MEKVGVGKQKHGFMQRRNTTDKVFTLRLLFERHRECKRGEYCVFVDLAKAYARITRKEIWCFIWKFGVTETYARAVEVVCESRKTVVRFAA